MTTSRKTATAAQFEKLFLRNCPLPVDGYVKLVCAVLRQAAADAIEAERDRIRNDWDIGYFLRKEPIAFWLNGGAGLWGEQIGLDPQFVLEQFIKHSGIKPLQLQVAA